MVNPEWLEKIPNLVYKGSKENKAEQIRTFASGCLFREIQAYEIAAFDI